MKIILIDNYDSFTFNLYHSLSSSKISVDVIRNAKKKGLKVTCDTSPQYFTLNEMAIEDYRTFVKVSPPLRSEKDRVAIVNGLKDGTIDAIQSDHSPQDEDNKRLGFIRTCTINFSN